MSNKNIIRLSKSCIGEEEKSAVMEVLDRGYLGMGKEVQDFENALSEFFGRPVVCVVNGTMALQLALQACGIGKGDEVIVQSLTYVASFQAISAIGAIPIACEIDPITLTMDWREAEKCLSSKTKAIMPVHYSGGVGALDEIYRFANKYGLRVIEDSAHAFGTIFQGKRIGSFGDISCFSFDGIKNITSGEGGCIVCNDQTVLQKIADARLLGVKKDTEMRYSGKRSWQFDVDNQGWRGHMSNIMAAIGLVQLKRFSELSSKRQKLALYYDKKLEKISNIIKIPNDYSHVVPHIYVIRIVSSEKRDLIRAKLLEIGIETGVHYYPNHLLSYYKKNNLIPSLSNTEKIYSELLTLPLHPELTESDIELVVHNLSEMMNE